MPIGYKDLIKANHLRTQVISIAGVGDVEIHELSATAVWEISQQQKLDREQANLFAQSKGAEGSEKTLDNEFYARVALQGVAGADQQISGKDVKAFIANTGSGVILEIFNAVITYNHVAEQEKAVEELQKN